jgi:uncharacterized protein (DUF2235 family)
MTGRPATGPSPLLVAGQSVFQGDVMAKNIILLSDGTGNSAASPQKTNVWRLYRALDLTNENPAVRQIASYDDGVGTSQFRPLALLGQAFGFGLAHNIRDLHAFLSRNYKASDDGTDDDKPRIFAFGFSRGAYTIRLLIDFVSKQGLVDSELPEEEFHRQIMSRWGEYCRGFVRSRVSSLKSNAVLTAAERLKERDEFEKRRARLRDDKRPVPDFEFVGLWDTVGAYGLPFEELQALLPLAALPDRRLSPVVRCAYHALSLDEERRSFTPILWDEGGSVESERIHQVWFPGVHASVGGGYPKDGLAYVSLRWIVHKAATLGLKFHDLHVKEINDQANAHDQMYNSRAGVAGYYRYSPRPVSALSNDPFNGVEIHRSKLHESALRRISGGRVSYGPIGIPSDFDLVLTNEGTTARVADGEIKIWSPVDRGPPLMKVGTIDRDEKENIRILAADPKAGSAGQGSDDDKLKSLQDYLNNDGKYLQDYWLDRKRVEQRATRMEVAWNLVWWRRVVYYLTLVSSLFLLAMPWLVGKWTVGSRTFTLSTKGYLPELTAWLTEFIAPILKAASYVVPAWVSNTWFVTFGKEPVLFLAGLLGVIATMAAGWWLDKTIHSRASDIWHDKAQASQDRQKLAEAATSTLLFKLRADPRTKTIYRWYRALIVQVIVLLVIVAGGIALLWEHQPDLLRVYGIAVVVLAVVYWVCRQFRLRPRTPPPRTARLEA